MNTLVTKLQEATKLAAATLRSQNHPGAEVLENVTLLQSVFDPTQLYVCLPKPGGKVCLLFPSEGDGLNQTKLEELSTQHWADKLIGYLNAAVEEGSLPSAQTVLPTPEQMQMRVAGEKERTY